MWLKSPCCNSFGRPPDHNSSASKCVCVCVGLGWRDRHTHTHTNLLACTQTHLQQWIKDWGRERRKKINTHKITELYQGKHNAVLIESKRPVPTVSDDRPVRDLPHVQPQTSPAPPGLSGTHTLGCASRRLRQIAECQLPKHVLRPTTRPHTAALPSCFRWNNVNRTRAQLWQVHRWELKFGLNALPKPSNSYSIGLKKWWRAQLFIQAPRVAPAGVRLSRLPTFPAAKNFFLRMFIHCATGCSIQQDGTYHFWIS